MKTPDRWAILLLATFIVLAGCGRKGSPDNARQPSPPPQEQPEGPPAPPGTPPVVPPEAAPARPPDAGHAPAQSPTRRPSPAGPEATPERSRQEPAPERPAPAPQRETIEPVQPQEATPAPTTGSTPQKPAAPGSKRVAKDVVVLTGSPMGGVRLDHKLHATRADNKCETCHHPSKPEKPSAAPQQKCADCHTKVAAAPMKTKYQAAFHNPTAQAGTCIGCHKAQNAKGKTKAPVKCAECHKKTNT